MTTKGEHEMSTFTLDVYWAQGKPPDPAIEAHVTACARCRLYLATLDAAMAVGAPAPRAAAPIVPLRRRARWVWLAAAMFVLPAGALLLVHGRSAATDDYVGTKGTPAVQVLLHRGTDTRIWDGQTPLRPGDALALRVACEGLEHVAVAAPGAKAWARLSDTACPAPGDALPFTLVVDGEPGDEKLAVVLSQSPLDDGVLRDAITRGERTKDVWVVDFVLPKETGTDR